MTGNQKDSLRITYLLLGVVVVVGVINFAAGIFVDGYQPDLIITGLFAGVLGARLGVQSIVYRKKSGSGKEGEDQ